MTMSPAQAQWISGPEYDYGPDDTGYYDGHLAGDGHRNHVLHRSFSLAEKPARATLTLAVLGYARIWVNGQRATNAELLGDWTNFTKLVYADEFDVIDLLHSGNNELVIELGNGWYNPSPLTMFGKYNLRERLAEVGTPCALAHLAVDGNTLLVSDENWTYAEGPLLFNNVYLGETWDNREEPARAHAAKAVATRPNTRTLEPAAVERCHAFEPVPGTDVRELPEGGLLVDFHQLQTGFVDVTFEALEGDVVVFRYAEGLNAHGLPSFASSYAGLVGELVPGGLRVPGGPGAPERAEQVDRVICHAGTNHLRNAFTYHSCRYLLIEGLAAGTLASVSFVPVHTALRPAGAIDTGNAWYDDLLDAAMRTKLNNVHGVWEDCARERLGYGGDMVALAASNLMAFDCERLIRKTVRDFRSDQTSAGGIPETAPFMGIGSNGTAYGEGPLLWQLAYPHLVLRAYQFFGARDLVGSEWPYVRRLVDYLLGWDPAELAAHCLGDHGSVLTGESFKSGTPDKELVGWCTIARFARAGARFCQILDEDGSGYERRLVQLGGEIRARFAHADGTWGDGTQTGIAFVADLGLIDEQTAGDMLANMFEDEGKVLSTGIFGTTLAFDLLHRTGHSDVVESWLNRSEHPSFHAMLDGGNRALAEQFETFLSSYNHAMFSSYAQWFYQALGGVRVTDDAVACDHMEIRPYFSPLTKDVACSYKTRRGTIRTSWTRANGKVAFTAEVPEGIKVDMQVPADVDAHLIRLPAQG